MEAFWFILCQIESSLALSSVQYVENIANWQRICTGNALRASSFTNMYNNQKNWIEYCSHVVMEGFWCILCGIEMSFYLPAPKYVENIADWIHIAQNTTVVPITQQPWLQSEIIMDSIVPLLQTKLFQSLFEGFNEVLAKLDTKIRLFRPHATCAAHR